MSSLQTFLDKHGIDLDALERIKHRVFIVGRFNRPEVPATQDPDCYLFTNRPDSELSAEYLDLFTKRFGLTFENFLKALQPAIAEEIEHGPIPAIIQRSPSQDGTQEGSVIINQWNFYFLRAIANSAHDAFQEDLSSVAREILREGERDPGRGIYLLIRKNLNSFCSFQPRTAEVINAFSSLLGSVGMLHGLPSFAGGGALPRGFLEKLVDFLYSPDVSTDFELGDGIVLDGVWERLKETRAQKSFVKVVNTFRNALLGIPDEYPDMQVVGGQAVYARAAELLGRRKDLSEGFREARDAYTGLAQIVRSKVLLSMVLEWVFRAHYELQEVKNLQDEDDQDMKVERLVLGKESHPGVAEPIPRASLAERDRFKTLLAEEIEKLIRAVVAKDEDLASALDALPGNLRALAEAVRANETRRDLICRMAGSGDPGPFIKAQKAILVDVLLPVLYQQPTLNLFELRELFRREVQTAYLTAITVGGDYEGVIREVAAKFLPKWKANIDQKTRAIKNADAMRLELLQAYIERVASRDIAERVIRAQENVRRALTVLENMIVAPGEARGVSTMTPIWTDAARSSRKSVPSERVSRAVGNYARDVAGKMLEEASPADKVVETVRVDESKTQSAAVGATAVAPAENPAGADAGGGASVGSSGGVPIAKSSAGVVGSTEKKPEDGLGQSVVAMVRDFLESGGFERGKREKTAVVDEIVAKAEAAPELVGQAQDAIRALHEVLNETYGQYCEKQGLQSFVGSVERMTLANLMLVNQEALNLGEACSNLYAMLLDVVENMDPKNPDPKQFIKHFSLTKYFDNDVIEKQDREKSGITELRQTLRRQGHESLQNTVSFISELRGIKYFIDRVRANTRAEIVVVNATADQFREWLVRDNVEGGAVAKGRLRSAFIKDANQATACPGLVYVTDSAFPPGGGKAEWLRTLAESVPLSKKGPLGRGGRRSFVLPPILLSTGVADDSALWTREGELLAKVASSKVAEPYATGRKVVPAPVLIVGPSPYMNRRGDVFGTYLPAGYVFASHFLNGSVQHVSNPGVDGADSGRFRVIGAGIGRIAWTLDRVLWGGSDEDAYSFAVDFYLYILLTVLASAQNKVTPGSEMPQAEEFFPYFTGHRIEGIRRNKYLTSRALDPALLASADRFALGQDVSVERLKSAFLVNPGGDMSISEVQWFNQVLEEAGLPRYASA